MKIYKIKEILIYMCIFFLPYTTFRIVGLKLSEIFMCILCFITLIKVIRARKISIDIKESILIKFFVMFTISIVISMCANFIDGTYLNKTGTRESIYYSYEYGWIFKTIRLFLVVTFSSILINFFKESEGNIRKVSNAYILSTFLINLYFLTSLGTSLFSLNFGIERTSLMAVEPSEAGFINAISIIIIFYDILINKNRSLKNIIMLIVSLVTQLYIGSAAALAFLVISIFLCMVYRATKDKKYRKFLIFVSIISIAIVYYLMTETYVFDKIINYEKYINIKGSSTIERITAIQTGWEMFKEKPILGFGWGNYGWFVDNYKTNDLYITVAGGAFSANNQYIVILSELGILGMTIFIYFIYQIYKRIKYLNKANLDKTTNTYFYMFLTTFIYVMLSNFTLNGIYSYQLWISISVIIYLYSSVSNKAEGEIKDGKR